MALIGAIWLACNPITLAFANDANSHASTLLCVVVGFWGLLRWWQTGSAWRGIVGGFALGYACTIRYTEFLLVLPVLFATVAYIGFDPRRIRRGIAPLIGWAIPITALAIVLWVSYGAPWKTGYSLCKEQTGFAAKYLLGYDEPSFRQGNWETLIFQLNHLGLFLILPLVIAGMFAMFSYSWKLAMVLVLWVVPPTTLYLFYYWGPVGEGANMYLRFFLTVFPGVIMAGLWLLDRIVRRQKIAGAIGVGVLTAVACLINVCNILPHMESTHESALSLRLVADRLYASFPRDRGNVIFTGESVGNYLDSVGGYTIYDTDLLRTSAFDGFKSRQAHQAEDDPSPLQRDRAIEYMHFLGNQTREGNWIAKPQSELDKMEMDLLDKAFSRHQRVAFILHGEPNQNLVPARADLQLRKLAVWKDLPPASGVPAGIYTRWVDGHREHNPQASTGTTWTVYEVVQVPTEAKPAS